MKKCLALALLLLGNTALADGPAFDDLTQSEVDDVSKEFAANFSHTTVSAPETDGLWGVEVGLAGGRTKSPDLKKVVDDAGEDGSDFENIYHAGLVARAHFPLDFYAELSLLPEREIAGVTIKNTSIGGGWNVGGFFGLPIDVALGFGVSNSTISFVQDNPVPDTKVELNSKTRIVYVGVSKKFLFFTPYLKIGRASHESDLEANAQIFNTVNTLSLDSDATGGYLAVGANLQFLIMRFGVEASKIMEESRVSAKLSIAF